MKNRRIALSRVVLFVASLLLATAPARPQLVSQGFVPNTPEFEAARQRAIQTYHLPMKLDDVENVGKFVQEDLFALDDLWRQVLATNHIAYRTPMVQFYFGGVNTTACQHLDDGNSYFCFPDHTIYLDIFLLVSIQEQVEQMYGTPGWYAAITVAAHEFGHAIEQLAPSPAAVTANRDKNYIGLMSELNADCYAGFFLSELASNNGMDSRGLNEALGAMELAGDNDPVATLSSPLTGGVLFLTIPKGHHGSPELRKGWMMRGYNQGPSACRAGYDGSFGPGEIIPGTILGSPMLPTF